jgi:hypothetical protein
MVMLVSLIALKKKYSLIEAIKKSIVISFFCSGIVYGVVNEFMWNRWFVNDISQFYGKNNDYKQLIVNDDFYMFINQCKLLIGRDNYSIYPDDTAGNNELHIKSARFQYYLLPSRKSTDSKFIVVLSDGNEWFDEAAGSFYTANVVKEKLVLHYRFNPDTYLLRVKE